MTELLSAWAMHNKSQNKTTSERERGTGVEMNRESKSTGAARQEIGADKDSQVNPNHILSPTAPVT